jgi:Family of unknown function (DUF5686)/CarboxypepD_reg-like domain
MYTSRLLLSGFFLFLTILQLNAQMVSGYVKDPSGNVLPFSSVLVKGSTKGVSANARGFYQMNLDQGEHTLVGQYIGYTSVEKKISLTKDNKEVDFVLSPRQYQLAQVEVTSKGEDPAYAIIRKAIAARKQHLKELNSYQCEVYVKGQLQFRKYPKSYLGKKVDFEDGDTSQRKMIYLSESVTRLSVDSSGKSKVEVISTKVSGRIDGFGFNMPQQINLYNNNIQLGEGLNPRGFISPLSGGALSYYRYRFEGTFFENGIEINRIKVTPKREYEPLFSGYINITEGDWYIHSADLMLLKKQQMQLLDTLRITQQFVPARSTWVIKNQVLYPSGKLLGFDFFGNFLEVYDQFNLTPRFEKKFFNNTIIKFYDSSNKKSAAYWDSIRPVPLLVEELKDYSKKDSLEKVKKQPAYLDSIDKKRNRFSFGDLLISGHTFSRQKTKESLNIDPLLKSFDYNTVEGVVFKYSPSYSKAWENKNRLSITPNIRYGIDNQHANLGVSATYSWGGKERRNISFSGGRGVYQFNPQNPIEERINSLATLLYHANHMKIYEAGYFTVSSGIRLKEGLNLSGAFRFQDRTPLQNLANPVSWNNPKNREFTPNDPDALTGATMPAHQAATLRASLVWRPGGKYIELPDARFMIDSKAPTFSASVTQGINGLLGSDISYTKWQLGIAEELNLKIGGTLTYNIIAAGFLGNPTTYLPDRIHIEGNQTIIAGSFNSTFQLAPYYQFSNQSKLSVEAHVEYKLNGLITNKIPGFKKLNWFLVTGFNGLHIQGQTNYAEAYLGLDNILKTLRFTYVQSFQQGGFGNTSGIRISTPLF